MKRLSLAMGLVLGTVGVQAADMASVYALAVQNDPAIAAAAATRDANFEAEPLAKSQLLPFVQLGGDANYNYQDVNKSLAGSYNDRFGDANAGIQLSQPIYRKDLNIQLDQAEDQVAQADIDYMIAEQDLIVRTVGAYFDVLAAQQTLNFTRADVKAIARQLEQAKQRFEVGLIAITDVNEAQARYDGARADEIVAKNNVDDAREALLEIIGVPVGPLADLKPTAPLDPPNPESLEEWTALALDNNPSILSAKYDAEIAKKEIERQDAGDSPALDLVGSYALARSRADTGVHSNNGILGVQLSLPLYTGGGVAAATRQARHQYDASQDVLEQTRRAVQLQVRNGYRGVLANISRVAALKATVVSAQSALEATEAGFEVGTRTLVDVLNRQGELFRAKRDLSVSRYDYVLNMLSLLQAAGTLNAENIEKANVWLEEPPPEPKSK
jgi:outer membrane protein